VRRAAGVGAGLEGHVDRRVRRFRAALAGVLDGGAFGVQSAELRMESLADHILVPHENGPDQRIRADPAATAFGELERPAQVRCVLFGADRGQPGLLRERGCD
jgi:hypothetical protein